VSRSASVYGAARNRPVGEAPGARPRDPFAIERSRGRLAGRGGQVRRDGGNAAAEPLADLQWDMRMIHATASESYAHERGRGVRVGIIDTGIDGSHPDIAPNFNGRLSRNFTTDIPLIDGPCEEEADQSCNDPADVDEDGHGTHVAGTIGSPINGFGIAGVAPRAELVNIRAGQDSGFFFLQPTVDALTYAANHGVDVVNMSFFIDPWLYNCANSPSDSPEEQLEQRTIIHATQRALEYAHDRGVTLIAAEGNENTDIGHPTTDEISPDYPPGNERTRQVDNSCLILPTEGRHVLSISSLGPTERKAYYSNYGVEQTFVSAPGGDRREFFGTDRYNAPENRVLAPYPLNVAIANGDLEPDGTPTNPLVVQYCRGGKCAYYQYLQGTSMASPHAVGVAAVVIGAHGNHERGGGMNLAPGRVARVLARTAREHPCPEPRTFTYPDPDLDPSFTASARAHPSSTGSTDTGSLTR
jgi:subtilisin family serine protease